MKNKRVFILLLMTSFVFLFGGITYADGTNDETLFDNYDFDEIDDEVMELSNGSTSFSEILDEIVNGDKGIIENTIVMIKNSIMREITYNKNNVFKVLILAVSLALLNSIMMAFNNSNYTETGFYVVYLILATTLVGAYLTMLNVASDVVSSITSFMKLVVPSYFMAIGVSCGYTSATSLCGMTVTILSVLEIIVNKILLPAVSIYIAISIANLISKEQNLSKLSGSILGFVNWSVKTMLAVVLGLNVIESMVAPKIDALKNKGITKVISMVPFAGNGISQITSLAISSASVIKNAIGASALVTLVVLSVVPLIKLLVFMAMYKILAISIQPISDKRVVELVDVIYEGGAMLYKIAAFSILIFGVSIAVISIATG